MNDQDGLQTFLQQLSFNEQGLIPAIAQQFDSGQVLMMAWMNRESLIETLEKGCVCYWSRSRQRLWRKGEQSGEVQRLVSCSTDCDFDALLLQVDQTGAACHTGRRHCFFYEFSSEGLKITEHPLWNPQERYQK